MTAVSRIALAALLAVLGLTPAVAQSAPTGQPAPVEPLGGLDPVLLLEGKEVDGDPKVTLDRGRFRYSFASAESRDRFAADPARYEIQNDGLCARMGGTVLGTPDFFAIHDAKLYLFGSEHCRELFLAHPEKYLPPPSLGPLSARSSPDARAEGRRFIDKAVAAIGGAARLDRLHALRYELHGLSAGDGGASTLKAKVAIAFPGRLWQERHFGNVAVVDVATPEGGFVIAPNGAVQPFVEIQRRHQLEEIDHLVPSLLKARGQTGFVAAVLGYNRQNGEAAAHDTRVAVEIDGEAKGTLEIAADGRVNGLAFVDRNDDGEWGEVGLHFGDFHTVDGLDLPYEITATWNGQPLAGRSARIAALQVDPELAAALFVPPAPEAAKGSAP